MFLRYESLIENELNINISDISGKEIKKYNVQTSSGENTLQLNTENLESGIYFIDIVDGNSSKKIKFIKL